MSESLFLKAALAYARRGWYVFPLSARSKIPPAGTRGVLDATTDETQIREWWSKTPDANVAIATGPSGLVIVDIDGDKGEQSLEEWQSINDEVIPKTVEARTPSGGRHLLFKHKDAATLAPGQGLFGKASKVDTRAGNSYIAAPPSVHPNGGTYEWLKTAHPAKMQPTELPTSLHALMTTPASYERREVTDAEGDKIVDGQDAHGARHAAILASKGFSQAEARAALGAMIETRFEGGWQGTDPKRPWTERDLDRWLKGAYEKFFDPDGGNAATSADELQAINDLLGNLIKTQAVKQRTPLFTAAELEGENIPPIKWIVTDLLPEGVSIFGGKPKTGKSWLALGLAIAVATDAPILDRPVVKGGEVLYLALEDNKRRLQGRLRKVVGKGRWPSRLTLALDWPRGEDSIKHLEDWLSRNPEAALVIVDTLAKVREVGESRNPYSDDYALVSAYGKLTQTRQIGIVLITHLRKLDADDPIDTMQGTMGVTGAADTFYVLKRKKLGNDGTLYYRGREIESSEQPIRFDTDRGIWVVREDNENPADTRVMILNAIETGLILEATPTQIAKLIDRDSDTVSAAMRRMVKDGQLAQTDRGRYFMPGKHIID